MIMRRVLAILMMLSISSCSMIPKLAGSLGGSSENSGVQVEAGDLGYNNKDYVLGSNKEVNVDTWADKAHIVTTDRQDNDTVTAETLHLNQRQDPDAVLRYQRADVLYGGMIGLGWGLAIIAIIMLILGRKKGG